MVNASLNEINLGFDLGKPYSKPQQPHIGTKEDCPHLPQDVYNKMMKRDPYDIMQARVPDEIPLPQTSGGTKQDLPALTPSQYTDMNRRDPYTIEQARQPDDIPPIGDQAKPAQEFEQSNLNEHESPVKITSIQNSTDEMDDFDFEMPARPPPGVTSIEEKPKPPVSTKEDLPHLRPAEYEAMKQRDSENMEQFRVQDDIPLLPGQHKTADQTTTGVKSSVDGFHPPSFLGLRSGDPITTGPQANVASEWDNVQEITARFDDGPAEAKTDPVVETTPLINVDEAIHHFRKQDLSRYKAQIKTSVTRHGFSAFCYTIFGPPKLKKDLESDRDTTFLIAACPFDNEDPLHFRVLKTIYRRLTGSKFDPQRFGGHWDQIGFQGTDPASDLRGCGFLGLINLLYLVMDPRTYPLARDIYRLSQHEQQNFPMALMSINITRLALQSLREDILNKECNQRHQVMETLNQFYAACFLSLYTIWKHQHKTIADSGFVIKDVETAAKKNPKAVLATLDEHLTERQRKAPTADLGNGETPLSFQAVCDLEDDD